jgi:hypothetical protein
MDYGRSIICEADCFCVLLEELACLAKQLHDFKMTTQQTPEDDHVIASKSSFVIASKSSSLLPLSLSVQTGPVRTSRFFSSWVMKLEIVALL